MSSVKLYVHVKNNGNQVFYKGDSLYCDEGNTVYVRRNEDDVAVICLDKGESVGEYFDATKQPKGEK